MYTFTFLLGLLNWFSAIPELQDSSCPMNTITTTDTSICAAAPCVIYFEWSDRETDSLKSALGEEDFYTVMDDYNWYFAEASNVLNTSHSAYPSQSTQDTIHFCGKGRIFRMAHTSTRSTFVFQRTQCTHSRLSHRCHCHL